MAARIAAGVAAIVLVVAAFAIRGGGSDGGGGGDPQPGGRRTLVCDPLFADACRAIGDVTVVVEDSGETADRVLAGEELDADAWVTSAAWPALVAGEQDRLGQPAAIGDTTVVARSAVGIAIWTERVADVEALGCEVSWACLGTNEGRTLAGGGRLQLGMPQVDTADGLVIAGTQGRSIVGVDDYAVNDFDSARRATARALASGQQDDPLRRMRTRGPGELTAAGVVLANAPSLSSNFGTITIVADTVTLDVVVVDVGDGRSASGDRTSLTASLAEAGWSAADDPALGAADGLPGGSVLAAVRTIWGS